MRPVLTVLRPTSCDGCGVCCEGIGSPVVLYASRPDLLGPHPFRPPGLPQELIDEIDTQFLGLRRGDEPQARCLWHDAETGKCRHYEWRPQVCRDYELGGRECLAKRRPFVVRRSGPGTTDASAGGASRAADKG